MRPSAIAALVLSGVLAQQRATTPTLTPGAAYAAGDPRPRFRTIPGYTSLPGADKAGDASYVSNLAAYARPEYTNIAPNIAPVGHWLAPCVTDQAFFADFTVKAASFAASPSGIRGGVKIARAWVDGYPLTVPLSPVSIPRDAIRGGSQMVPGYEFTLPWAQIAEGRTLEMYWEFVPSDEMAALGMGTRIIGPMYLTRKTQHDIQARIDRTAANSTLPAAGTAFPWTGLTFNSELALINAIAARCGTSGDLNTASFYAGYAANAASQASDVAQWSASKVLAFNSRTARGVFDGGGTVTIANTANTAAYVQFRPGATGCDFVNFKWNNKLVQSYCGRNGERTMYRIVGGEMYSDNQNEASIDGQLRSATLTKDSPIAAEQLYVHDTMAGDNGLSVWIGCYTARTGGDAHNLGYPVPLTIVASDEAYHGNPVLGDPSPMLTLNYSGSGNPTYAITGSIKTNARTLTLYVDDVAVPAGAFQASTTQGTGIYTMTDLMNAINALGGGWSCAKVANFDALPQLRFANLAYPLNSAPANPSLPTQAANGAVDISAITGSGAKLPISLGIRAGYAVHTDYMQWISATNNDNILFLCGSSLQGLHQLIYPASNVINANCAIVLVALNNNADYPSFADFTGQASGDNRHLIVYGVTQPTGRLSIRTDPGTYDQFTLFMNIYARDVGFGSLTSTNFKGRLRNVVSSRWTTGGAPAGIDASNVVTLAIGSASQPTLFDTGNFSDIHGLYAMDAGGALTTPSGFTLASLRPRGTLRTMLVQSELDQDFFGNPTVALDMVGAVALAA